MTDRNGIEIDYCPDCRGVWLNRREHDKIIGYFSQNIKNVQYDNYSEKQLYPTERDFHYKKEKGLLGDFFIFSASIVFGIQVNWK